MKISHAAFAFKVRQIWGILYTRLPCFYILEFSNKKTKHLKILLPDTKKLSSSNLWREVLLCIVLLKYSLNLALHQQDCKNPLSNRSLLKDNCSIENPQDVHTGEAEVHSPAECMRSTLAYIHFLWKARKFFLRILGRNTHPSIPDSLVLITYRNMRIVWNRLFLPCNTNRCCNRERSFIICYSGSVLTTTAREL